MKNNKLYYVLLLIILIGCNSEELVPSIYVDTKNSIVVCNNCKIKEMFAIINYDNTIGTYYTYRNYLIDNSIIDADTINFSDLRNENQRCLKKTDLSTSKFRFWVQFETRSGSFFPPFVLEMPSQHNKDSIFELKRLVED